LFAASGSASGSAPAITARNYASGGLLFKGYDDDGAETMVIEGHGTLTIKGSEGGAVVELANNGSVRAIGNANIGPNSGSVANDTAGCGIAGDSGQYISYIPTSASTSSYCFIARKTNANGGGIVFSVDNAGRIDATNVTFSLDDGTTMDVKRVGTALKALKAAAIAASDFNSLKSAIVTALADIDNGGSY
jgi:hypothetical protein